MVEFNPGGLSINTLLCENAARFSVFQNRFPICVTRRQNARFAIDGRLRP
jgi:hypothetical protein